MRHQYTCIFSDVLTSRIWAMSPSTRAVWLWFMLKADPEGFVCASTAGVAIGANVTLEAATLALEELTELDPDEEPVQILEKVPRGWRLVGFEALREQARAEGQKARNRKYMARYRARAAEVANDTSTSGPLAAEVDAPIPIPKPIPRSPDLVVVDRAHEAIEEPMGSRVVPSRIIHAIPDSWEPSQELRQEAQMAGVLRFDEQVASLRGGPVGGARGIFENGIDRYVRGLLGGWRIWEETQRAKATAAAAAAKPRGQSYRRPGEEPPELVDFDPRYLSTSHSDFCDRAGLGAAEPLAREWRAIALGEGKPLSRPEADKAFAKWLGKRAKSKGRAA